MQYYLLLTPSNSDKKKTIPPRMHRADPAQPMNRAAPNSNLRRNELVTLKPYLMSQHLFSLMSNNQGHTFAPQTRGQKIQPWSCGHTANRQSKSRALRLQKLGLHEKRFNSLSQYSTAQGLIRRTLHTTDKILKSGKACDPCFDLITSTDFGALHSHQSTGSCKETKTHSWDHQTSAHLDVTYHKILK